MLDRWPVRDPFAANRLDALSNETAWAEIEPTRSQELRIGFGTIGWRWCFDFENDARCVARRCDRHSTASGSYFDPEQQVGRGMPGTPVRFPRIAFGIGGGARFASEYVDRQRGDECGRPPVAVLPTRSVAAFFTDKVFRLADALGNVERRRS